MTFGVLQGDFQWLELGLKVGTSFDERQVALHWGVGDLKLWLL